MENKRKVLVYVTVFLWILLGSLGVYYKSDLSELAMYFLSLTGFIASYIWGESKRPSETTSIFQKGKSSSRETMVYIVVLLWTICGVGSIVTGLSIPQIATYFGALTPFVGSYILGQSYKPEKK